jgi:hypothetical protein
MKWAILLQFSMAILMDLSKLQLNGESAANRKVGSFSYAYAQLELSLRQKGAYLPCHSGHFA